MSRIYLDNHATTRVDPRVLEGMLPYFADQFGNAASVHCFGREARHAVEEARAKVARLLNADPSEIVFTSGATEADNLAIKGALASARSRGNHVVTVATEHKAVLDTCKALARSGAASVTFLPVDGSGLMDPASLRESLRSDTVLVSVMHANNEIGVLQPIAEIARICRERGILFHTDATQSVGKVPFDLRALDVDLASASAHKMYGPKGVGCLYVRRHGRRVRLSPLIDGGGHEGGLRSGSLPVPLVVGFGLACEIASREMADEAARLRTLRDALWSGLEEEIEGVHLNGHAVQRLPGNLNVSIVGVESEGLIMALGDVAISSSSACSSATVEPSHVLRAIGVGDDLIYNAVRFGLGRFNTAGEVDEVIHRVAETVERLRRITDASVR